MEEFTKKNLIELRKLTVDELSRYYRDLRKYNYDNNLEKYKTPEIRYKLNNLIQLLLKIDKLIAKREVHLLSDDRSYNKEARIYTSSHVGRYDIETNYEIIHEPVKMVVGDPGYNYLTLDGLFWRLFGTIFVDTGYQVYDIRKKIENNEPITKEEQELYDSYKTDRHMCLEYCENYLKNKDNIIIYPEGAWNTTDKITTKFFPGAAKMAIDTDSELIPIGMVRDNKTYEAMIGKNINVHGATSKDVKDVTEELQARVNELVWKIVATRPLTSRNALGTNEEQLAASVKSIMDESDDEYTLDVIEKSRYEDKSSPEYVKNSLGITKK